MAERPVFIPAPDALEFVIEKNFTIAWAGGFAAVQKKKNIKALHKAAEACGFSPILEASTKSDEKLGQRLSAFNLKVQTDEGQFPLECAYQGSKVFERGGPYTDLFFAEPKAAKRDPRLQSSGRLIAFYFAGHKFPLEPKTVFYDWLYITAIFPHKEFLFRDERLPRYAGFTDIEFNPSKSINCQARACALFVSLNENNLLEEAVQSPESFIAIVSRRKRPVPPQTLIIEAPQTRIVLDADGHASEHSKLALTQNMEHSVAADAAPRAGVQDNADLAAPTLPAPDAHASDRVLAGIATLESKGLDDRSTLSVHNRPTPPSNFELFFKEKAAREGTRKVPTRPTRSKKL